MEYLIILSLVVPLIIGLLLGMIRGLRRATLRIVLVILCLVAAFCLKGVVTDNVMQTEVADGQTVEQYIIAQLGEDYASLGEVVTPIVTLIVTAIVFLLLFFGIKFLSWIIVYPICKIFVKKARKKEDGTYGKKHALIGGVIGLVQGAAVALVMCVMLNGLFFNMANVAEAMSDMQETQQTAAEPSPDQSNGDGNASNLPFDPIELLAEYKQSKTCEIVSAGGNKVFDVIVSVKTEEGKKLTLTGQLDALSGIVKMAKELSAIQNMEMTGGLSGDVATDIVTIFNKLDEISSSLSEESKETMNKIVQIAAEEFLPDEIDVDLSVIDFTAINFANEGQVISKLNEYKDIDSSRLTMEDAETIVETVMQSDIILPLLSCNDQFTIGLDEQQQQYAESVINDLASKPEADTEKIDMLKNFFGLNDQQ